MIKHASIAPTIEQFIGTTTTPSWLWGVAHAQQQWEQQYYLPLRTQAAFIEAPYIEVYPRDLFAAPIMPPVTQQSQAESHHIVHITNNRGGWGAGFTGALSKALGRGPEHEYRNSKGFHQLGRVLQTTSECSPHLPPQWHSIFHCCAQDGYRSDFNPRPFSLATFAACLRIVRTCLYDYQEHGQPVVHMPRVGAGLGGSPWKDTRLLIIDELCKRGIPVIVYGLEA